MPTASPSQTTYPTQPTGTQPRALIIGSGVGGLATAIRLQLQGYQATIFEANDQAGGKVGEFRFEGFRFDAGPSLFTLPEQIDALFRLAGKNPKDYFEYEALPVITRYFYPDGTQLNAFQDPEAFAQEIEAKTGEPAERVRALLKKSAELYGITSHVFLERSLHKLGTYLRWETVQSALQLHKLDAFRSMATANAQHFSDPRVQQLFNRYATYNGSDPYQAPATLNIIPHLEHQLGAYLPKGGMYQITRSLVSLAEELGVDIRLHSPVSRILHRGGRITGLEVAGETYAAELVVSNADIVPTYRRLLPDLPAPERTLQQPRSSSALIFYWGMEKTWPQLDVHNIFFSGDYGAEFDAIWQQQTIGPDPTVYVYISAKQFPADAPAGKENWFVMINVPPDYGQNWEELIQQAGGHILGKLSGMLGEPVEPHISCERVLEPRTIQSRTSSHLGALYGNSSNNRFAAFLRHPNFSSKLSGLYFCGGSVHPGGGIPLCLLSARIVADLVAEPRA